MISLELATEGGVAELPITPSLGVETDPTGKSDRMPSLWQSGIIDRCSGPLVHIFDKGFVGSDGERWLYEAVDTQGWERFRFKDAEEQDFFAVLKTCLEHGSVWLLADAQFGPKPRVYQPQTLARFVALYNQVGIRINSAVPIRS
jgi:hypothetical protein